MLQKPVTALALLIGLAACGGEVDAPADKVTVTADISASAEIRLINVHGMLEDAARRKPLDTDISFPVENSDRASLHIHALGPGQMTPLHLHSLSHETTLVLNGSPVTRHWYEEAGQLQRYESVQAPNTLIAMSPGAGHEWENASEGFQANLVHSTPTFYGNFYLHEDDERLQGGGPPTIMPLDVLMDGLPAGEGLVDLGLPGVSAISVESEFTAGPFDGNSYIYVVNGQASLSSASQQSDIRPGQLVFLPAGVSAALVAQERLSAYLFRL